ncbi:MAG TPA: SseB family protein [Thiobacillaceae bacterium]|nr:SseB family protein [Thiobacillaceae bacterium]
MKTAEFSPHNDLEQQLADVHAGILEVEDFVARLLNEQIFMPVKDEKHAIAGFQRSTQAEPLILEDEDGTKVVVVFTSPERAKPFLESYPNYKGGILTEFSWLLKKIGGGFPIALNPGWEIGLDFDAEMVASLIASMPPEHSN